MRLVFKKARILKYDEKSQQQLLIQIILREFKKKVFFLFENVSFIKNF